MSTQISIRTPISLVGEIDSFASRGANSRTWAILYLFRLGLKTLNNPGISCHVILQKFEHEDTRTIAIRLPDRLANKLASLACRVGWTRTRVFVSLLGRGLLVAAKNAPKQLTLPEEMQATPPVYSIGRESEFIEWNGLYCRSAPEETIAKELERRGLDFMLNPGGRFTIGDARKTREPDFLIFLGDGKTAILEVDGEQYHQSAAADHERDRIFRKMGIPVERFTASRCLKDPKGVVDDFLACMK
jgi:hypothetical protein